METVGRPPPPRDPQRRLRSIALLVLCALVLLFCVSIVMERATPTTAQAVVQAYVVPMAAEVPGRVSEVPVLDNARVRAGEVLFRIDPQPYRIAEDQAEARLLRVGQTIGASTAAIDAAQARVADARANRDNVAQQAGRVMQPVQRGLDPPARRDEARAALERSEAMVAAAEAELERAHRDLGPTGEDNPLIREALASLERARLDLSRATVVAPADGLVTNLQLSPGQYVSAGHPAMTFVDVGTVWLSAAFKENSLEHLRPGNTAEVVFDTLPGRVYSARVESVGWGVAAAVVERGGLPAIRNEGGWVREPQRFPVRLVSDDDRPMDVRYGSRANVVVYTGDNPFMNALGAFWIRLVSVLTYAR